MSKFRTESDLLGDLQVPFDAYYGVQTQRAIDNFHISGSKMSDFPEFVRAIAYVKLAAAQTNHELGLLSDSLLNVISQACNELIEGKMHDQFPVDMIQGGAGTSVNMNANEVIANRALQIMGHGLGDYQHCSPNDHINLSQSTNDAYPTTIKLAIIRMNQTLIEHLRLLIASFRKKGVEFADVIKMGRTQLQDAVPMTLGQEFEAFAATLEEEITRLQYNANLFLEINMGGTAIGTGINAPKEFPAVCAKKLADLTGEAFVAASNLVEATPDTGSYVIYSSALKRMAG
ncbi:lyase family protein, partial [Capnocytophaga canis]|uniref:lyase family protein n=1 Tax=Capnocytophaga canis TaxID=1848903 RepID=UPI0005A6377C